MKSHHEAGTLIPHRESISVTRNSLFVGLVLVPDWRFVLPVLVQVLVQMLVRMLVLDRRFLAWCWCGCWCWCCCCCCCCAGAGSRRFAWACWRRCMQVQVQEQLLLLLLEQRFVPVATVPADLRSLLWPCILGRCGPPSSDPGCRHHRHHVMPGMTSCHAQNHAQDDIMLCQGRHHVTPRMTSCHAQNDVMSCQG